MVQGTEGMWAVVNRLNADSWSIENAGKLGRDIRAQVRPMGKAAHR